MKLIFALLIVVAISSPAIATPMAWGQPMPEHCTTTFVWKEYPVHVYKDASCAAPWAANAATFWKGIANWFRDGHA